MKTNIEKNFPVIVATMANAIYQGPPGPEVDLTNYYTKSEVDGLIETIELTPGPQGEPGQDYILTEADKSEIAGMVVVDTSTFATMAQVEAKGYQTEANVNALINTALGVIENGTY